MSSPKLHSPTIAGEDAQRIQNWNDQLAQPLSIRFVATEDPRTREFALFCEDLQNLAPKLRITQEAGAATDLPAIHVDGGWSYHALPRGGELPPFLELLTMVSRGERSATPQGPANWQEKIAWPAEVKIYVTPQCPFCPQMLRQLQALPMATPLVHLTVIDGMLFSELAASDGIRSVPTVILDGQFRWSGTMALKSILETLVHREPQQLSTETLKGMIKDGAAEQVAAMMVEANLIFPSFWELLTDSDWSTRLGAMVVVEAIADRRPPLAASIASFIVAHLGSVADAVTGDLIYLLGSVGSQEDIPKLEEYLKVQDDEQMREVLQEALEKLGHSTQHP